MKPELSIIAFSPEAGAMSPFLENLAGQVANVEVLLAGRADDVTSDARDACAAGRIALRFLPLGDGAVGCGYADWSRAVSAAEADCIWHADQYTRFISENGLRHNVTALLQSHADIAHFAIHLGSHPVPGTLTSEDILVFFLQRGFDSIEIVNKIYSRELCRKAVLDPRAWDGMPGPPAAFVPQLILAALAQRCVGDTRDMAEYEMPLYSLDQHARFAAALYAALLTLPARFIRLGHAQAVARISSLRFRAELALHLGRSGRLVAEDPTLSDADYLRALLDAFGDDKTLLNALVLGTAENGAKCEAIYQTIYGDTVFRPCPAYRMNKFTDAVFSPAVREAE